MQTKQIKVGDDIFNVGMANAELQLELYEMLFSRLLMNTITSSIDAITPDMIKGLIASGEKGTIKTVADIVLSRAVFNGTERQPTVRDFQGRINDYVTLVSECVCFNLSDFFFYLENQVTIAKQKTELEEVGEINPH